MPPRKRAPARRRSPAKRTATPAPAPQPIQVPTGGSVWMLDVPFELRSVATYAGARWDPGRRVWMYVGHALPAGLEPFAAAPHTWAAWQEDDLLTDLGLDPRRFAPAPAGITLRAHQHHAVDAILKARAAGLPGFLLADEVGLGKTYTAIEAIRNMDGVERVLIVSPLAVLPGFRRSIDALGADGIRWCAINYESLKRLVSVPDSAAEAVRARTKNRRIAEKGESLVDWDVVVFDEAHRLKNPTSQRSKVARTLAGTAQFTIWMSATAGQNPLELAYLAPLLGAVTGTKVRDLEAFEQWCSEVGLTVKRGDFGKWIWDPTPGDLELIHQILFEAHDRTPAAGIRRLPTDIAGWPEIQRIPTPVDLDPSDRRLYLEAWGEFRDAMALARRGRDTSSGLVAQLRFRQKSSLLRVDATVDLIDDLLSNGRQVAVSVEFHETIDAIADALDKARIAHTEIHGRQTPAEKEHARVTFQQGHVPVVLFTPAEGISLHQDETAVNGTSTPRALVVHDLRWSAIAMAQIEGRTHRDGKFAPAYWMYAADTHDERILRVVLERTTAMKSMVGDDTSDLDAIHTALFGDD